jgi:hypothetical protein
MVTCSVIACTGPSADWRGRSDRVPSRNALVNHKDYLSLRVCDRCGKFLAENAP